VQYSTVQYCSALHYSTAQYSTIDLQYGRDEEGREGRTIEVNDWGHAVGHKEGVPRASACSLACLALPVPDGKARGEGRVSPEVEQVEVRRVTAEDLKRATGQVQPQQAHWDGAGGGRVPGSLPGREAAVKKLSSNSQTEPDFPGGGARLATPLAP